MGPKIREYRLNCNNGFVVTRNRDPVASFGVSGVDIDLRGPVNMYDNKITGAAVPTDEKDVANKAYVDTKVGSPVIAGDMNANNHKILNLGVPTLTTDAAPKGYVDTTIETALSKMYIKSLSTMPNLHEGAENPYGINVTSSVTDSATSDMWGPFSVPRNAWECPGAGGNLTIEFPLDRMVWKTIVSCPDDTSNGAEWKLYGSTSNTFSEIPIATGTLNSIPTTTLIAKHTPCRFFKYTFSSNTISKIYVHFIDLSPLLPIIEV